MNHNLDEFYEAEATKYRGDWKTALKRVPWRFVVMTVVVAVAFATFLQR